jgi:uncharacterized protein (TIGR02598 family)
MNGRGLRPANGFSLVEVALSLAILAVGMTGVMALLPVGLDGARQVHAETVASQIVRGAVADFSTNGYSSGGFAQISGVPNGGTLRTESYDLEGRTIPAASAYFSLTYVRGEVSAAHCRYFLTLSWPANAAPNSRVVQSRTFVTDVIRNF